MNGTDVLLALSQLSVALAGFSGIIVALRQRSLEHWPKHELVRFRYMLELAVYSIGFDLLPLLLTSFEINEMIIWKISSVSLAIWLVHRIIKTARIQKNVKNRLNRYWFYTYQIGSGIVIAVVFLNVFDLVSMPSQGLYFVGLGWLLFFSLSLFVRLSLSPITSE